MSDIKEAKKTCKDVLISDLTRNRLLHQEEGLTTIQGLDIDLSWFKLKPEQWIRILEQVQTILLFLMIILYSGYISNVSQMLYSFFNQMCIDYSDFYIANFVSNTWYHICMAYPNKYIFSIYF